MKILLLIISILILIRYLRKLSYSGEIPKFCYYCRYHNCYNCKPYNIYMIDKNKNDAWKIFLDNEMNK